jgi:hypothetical protein
MGEILVATQLTTTQQMTVSVRFTDAHGNLAQVDGTPDWRTDADSVISLQPAPDGISCTASARGALGVAKITCSADADLGAGVVPLLGTLDIEVVAGLATVIELTAGPPTEQEARKGK